MSLLDTLLDQSDCFWVSGQVQRSVSPCILHGKIYTEGHEALENIKLRISCSLMDTIVPVNILVKRVHSCFHE